MDEYFNNYSNESYEEYEYNEEYVPCIKEDIYSFVSVFIPIIYSLIFIIGCFGNITTAIIYYQKSMLKTITNICIFNLAISDLLLICTLPLWAFEVNHGWKFGPSICKIASFIYTFNFTLGAFLLVYIAIDHYYAIVQEVRFKVYPLWFILIWSCAILFSLPDLIFSTVIHVHYHPRIQLICTFVYTIELTQVLRAGLESIEIVTQFIIPCIFIFGCYGIIAYKLKQTNKFQNCYILIALVMLFFITQLPYTIAKLYSIVDVFYNIITSCSSRKQLDYALQTTHCLSLLHACINPIFYMYSGSIFKKYNYFDQLLNKNNDFEENVDL